MGDRHSLYTTPPTGSDIADVTKEMRRELEIRAENYKKLAREQQRRGYEEKKQAQRGGVRRKEEQKAHAERSAEHFLIAQHYNHVAGVFKSTAAAHMVGREVLKELDSLVPSANGTPTEWGGGGICESISGDIRDQQAHLASKQSSYVRCANEHREKAALTEGDKAARHNKIADTYNELASRHMKAFIALITEFAELADLQLLVEKAAKDK